MKQIFSLLFLSIFLASCANTVTPVPNVTVTPQVTVTFTTAPTEIPATPTATPDPNAPKGTLGTDAQGLYIEANGVKNRQIELTDPATGEVTKIWAGMLNEGEIPIPMLDVRSKSEAIGLHDQMWLYVLVDPNVPGAGDMQLLSHPLQYDGDHVSQNMNFNDLFHDLIDKRKDILGEKIGGLEKPLLDIVNGNVTVGFFTSAGEFDWKLGPNTNVTTIFRPIEDLPLMENSSNGVVKYIDSYDSGIYYLAKMYTVKGNLFCEIASNVSLDKLSRLQFAEMALFAPISIMEGENHSMSQNTLEIHRLAEWAIAEQYPFFVFTPKP